MMVIQSEQIEIDKIIIGERARKDFGDIESLAKSISEVGLLQPILVSSIGDEALLLDGHRRILAFKKLGLKTIPAYKFNPFDENDQHDMSKQLQAQQDANVFRKDFIPSEAVELAEKILSWIETKRRFEKDNEIKAKDQRVDSTRKKYPPTELLSELQQKKKDSDYARTRDVVAKSVGMSFDTLNKAKAVVESAKENPENADLVQQMDETGKVNPVYKEMQSRKNEGKEGAVNGVPGKIVSLIVKMPDGRQKKMGSISNEWFQNKNILYWIIENVGLGVEEKDIVIHRAGNTVQVFDSTNIERLRQGINYLVKMYSESSLIEGKEGD